MRIKFVIYFFLILGLVGCSEPIDVGSSYSGYQNVEGAKIQPNTAIELAKEYLNKSFELRKANIDVSRNNDKEPAIFVTLKDDYYYIVKENYPAKSIYFYLDYAVKVHKDTGEVIPPK